MRETFSIAKNSFMELLRQPIFLILMSTSSVFIVFLSITPYFGLGEDLKLVKTGTMAVLLLSGLFAAVLATTSSLTDELKGGTALAVLSKPVGRVSFLLGKLIGVCSGLTVMVYINLLSILLASRMGYDSYGDADNVASNIFYGSMALAFGVAAFMNYFLEKNFVSNAVGSLTIILSMAFVVINFFDKDFHLQQFAAGVDWSLLPAVVCILFMLWLIASLAVTCSTRMDMLATLTICILVLMLGLMSDYLFGRMAEAGSWIGSLLYTIIPNWQNFWLADAIENENGIPWAYVAHAFSYMLCFMAAVVSLGFCMFDNRELN